jgi:hypothetical protein
MTRDTPWADFRAAEPAFSDRVAARFSCHPHHVVGTLAPDGRPRLWGSSIFVSGGHLWFGVMPRALRTADLRRDPRVAVHSAPLDEKLSGGDARVEGTATVLGAAESAAWMTAHVPADGDGTRPPGDVVLVGINRVVLTEVEGDMLVMSVWEPGRGLRIVQRQ